MNPNIAAALSYAFWFITGIIFFILEKENKFVRFHAMQSIMTFGLLAIVGIGLGVFIPMLYIIPFVGLLFTGVVAIANLAVLALWIVLMIKAYNGEKFKLPIVGDLAEKNS